MRINKITGYAIRWLSHDGNSVEDIANELDLSVKQVSNFLEKHNDQNTSKLAITSAPVTSPDLMIRHTRDKKINNVAVMTREASMMNDAAKQKMKNHVSTRNANCIYRPKKK